MDSPSSILGDGDLEWTPRRASIDPACFDCGRVGPYALGPVVRTGMLGPVHLALGAQFDSVLEVERVEIGGFPDEDMAPRLLDRLNHCVGAQQRHLASLLGAGVDSGQPYVLRAHVLGRTLGELMDKGFEPTLEVAAGISFASAEALQFLDNLGPKPGMCGLGGVDENAIHLGWDGSIRVLGAGLSLVRDRRPEADFESWKGMVARIEPALSSVLELAPDWPEAVRAVRTEQREACAQRQISVGAWLRRIDQDGCEAYRRLFGLPTLQ